MEVDLSSPERTFKVRRNQNVCFYESTSPDGEIVQKLISYKKDYVFDTIDFDDLEEGEIGFDCMCIDGAFQAALTRYNNCSAFMDPCLNLYISDRFRHINSDKDAMIRTTGLQYHILEQCSDTQQIEQTEISIPNLVSIPCIIKREFFYPIGLYIRKNFNDDQFFILTKEGWIIKRPSGILVLVDRIHFELKKVDVKNMKKFTKPINLNVISFLFKDLFETACAFILNNTIACINGKTYSGKGFQERAMKEVSETVMKVCGVGCVVGNTVWFETIRSKHLDCVKDSSSQLQDLVEPELGSLSQFSFIYGIRRLTRSTTATTVGYNGGWVPPSYHQSTSVTDFSSTYPNIVRFLDTEASSSEIVFPQPSTHPNTTHSLDTEAPSNEIVFPQPSTSDVIGIGITESDFDGDEPDVVPPSQRHRTSLRQGEMFHDSFIQSRTIDEDHLPPSSFQAEVPIVDEIHSFSATPDSARSSLSRQSVASSLSPPTHQARVQINLGSIPTPQTEDARRRFRALMRTVQNMIMEGAPLNRVTAMMERFNMNEAARRESDEQEHEDDFDQMFESIIRSSEQEQPESNQSESISSDQPVSSNHLIDPIVVQGFRRLNRGLERLRELGQSISNNTERRAPIDSLYSAPQTQNSQERRVNHGSGQVRASEEAMISRLMGRLSESSFVVGEDSAALPSIRMERVTRSSDQIRQLYDMMHQARSQVLSATNLNPEIREARLARIQRYQGTPNPFMVAFGEHLRRIGPTITETIRTAYDQNQELMRTGEAFESLIRNPNQVLDPNQGASYSDTDSTMIGTQEVNQQNSETDRSRIVYSDTDSILIDLGQQTSNNQTRPQQQRGHIYRASPQNQSSLIPFMSRNQGPRSGYQNRQNSRSNRR